jgi:hypothetical protein
MSLDSEVENAASNCKNSVTSDVYGNCNSSRGRCNTTSLLNAVLDNSPSASTSRSTMEGMLFDSSREQTQDNSEVEFLTRTASLPCSAGILSHNEENYTEQVCVERLYHQFPFLPESYEYLFLVTLLYFFLAK